MERVANIQGRAHKTERYAHGTKFVICPHNRFDMRAIEAVLLRAGATKYIWHANGCGKVEWYGYGLNNDSYMVKA